MVKENVASVIESGADTIVAGSAVFGGGDYAANITALRDAGVN